MPRGQQAEEQAGADRQNEREGEHARIEPDVVDAQHRHALRRELPQQLDAPLRHEHAAGAAAQREQDALGQRLSGETQAAGAERRAYRHLALARRRFGEQQVRHVDARDEQHEGDRAEKSQKAVTHRRLKLVAQGRHVRAVVTVGLGILLLKLRADPIHLGPRPLERHRRLQPRVDAQKVIRT